MEQNPQTHNKNQNDGPKYAYGRILFYLSTLFVVGLLVFGFLWQYNKNHGLNNLAIVRSGIVNKSTPISSPGSVSYRGFYGSRQIDARNLTSALATAKSFPLNVSSGRALDTSTLTTWPTGLMVRFTINTANRIEEITLAGSQCVTNYRIDDSAPEIPPLKIVIDTASPFEYGGVGGICALKSVAQSIVRTFNLRASEYSDDAGKTFRKSFLAQLAKSSGAAKGSHGYTHEEGKRMHESFKTKDGYTFKCEAAEPAFYNLEERCRAVAKSRGAGADCNVSVRASDGTQGHAMNVQSVRWNSESKQCEVVASDTTSQGVDGNKVPVASDPSKVSNFSFKINTGDDRYEKPITIASAKNKPVDFSLYDRVGFYCCDKVKSTAK